MIDRKPTPGDWTDSVMEPYCGSSGISPMLNEPIPARVSEVLGPDGNPVLISVPRHRLGFDLTTLKFSVSQKETNDGK